MKKKQIKDAIEKAQKGISQYIEIMEILHNVDVSTDRVFQKKYNAFYRVRQRPEEWYNIYYSLLEKRKSSSITFNDTLDLLNSKLGRYEPSFASKLAATANPYNPIWDVHILNNTGHTAPSYSSKNKFNEAKSAYQSIESWYTEFLQSEIGILCVNTFNENVSQYYKVTDLKKVDFILWQTRP